MKNTLKRALACLSLIGFTTALHADVTVPNIFSDHMVLQREIANPIWGKADPSETITVTIAGQQHQTIAGADGTWRVELEALPAGGPHELVVTGKNTVTVSDILVGEVWICSGQSNMQWTVNRTNEAKIVKASANYPQIRFFNVPNVGTQELQDDIDSTWKVVAPNTVGGCTAVGYFFAKRLYNTLGVPVGLINNAWGGSPIEGWIARDVFEADPKYANMLAKSDESLAGYTDAVHEQKLAAFNEQMAAWQAGGKKGQRPRYFEDPRASRNRPGNIYAGKLHPTIGYGIRGVIWYQGESNTGRAMQYRELFPLAITSWREAWGQGDFPFYWVQLADHRGESDTPQQASAWAELREAQTMTLDAVPNGGEAVIIDVGEGRDIHPRNKQMVANRLARIALARDYGYDIPYQSPRYQKMEITDGKVLLNFDHVTDEGLYTFDVKEPIGFTIAGADQKFVWAEAKLVGKNQVLVWSEEVSEPEAVRYGWAENPVINLYDREGLPATPFRTDNWQRPSN